MRRALAAALLLPPLAAGPPAAAAPPALGDVVARLVARSGLRAETVGVAVIDPRDGALLAGHRAGEPVLPASCLKVASTGAALLALGAEFPLRTSLLALPPAAGRDRAALEGDLWLVGRGDPGISEHGPEGGVLAALDALAGQAAARGLRSVAGDLVVDASYFSGPRVHASWTDAGPSARWFAAEVDALTVNDGCVDVTAEPADGPARLSLFPETGIVTLVNRVQSSTSRKDHDIAFSLSAEGNTLEVRGRVGLRQTEPAAIHDPALLCGEQVGRALARAGIRVAGGVRRPREGERPPPGAALLAEHRTPLAAACAVANTRSQNLWAETVLRVLGAERGGAGSFEGGVRAVKATLALPGLDPVDGSGLSRLNRATAESLARTLALLWRSPARDAFFAGFAAPGSGTLEKRFREPRYQGKVRAKTGTLRGVSGLVGLATGPDGSPACFAVLGEHVEVGRARLLQDAVVDALVAGER